MGTRRLCLLPWSRTRDHPHAYGDKRLCRNKKFKSLGSSPRVWGQAHQVQRKGLQYRIIPTRMGTSQCGSLSAPVVEDHPHAYGDKQHCVPTCTAWQGSSPRVWGQEYPLHVFVDSYRIIPTRMGTSLSHYHSPNKRRDHPHAYGDKYRCILRAVKLVGSSPRVWGQVYLRSLHRDNAGIIPTRMGTSFGIITCILVFKDHPHAYGDKVIMDFPEIQNEGSSPRVWGQVCHTDIIYLRNRIIPTRMGTRNNISIDKLADEDHPHAYGDK